MSRFVLRGTLLVPVLTLALATSTVVARPPDLPVNTEDHCTPNGPPVAKQGPTAVEPGMSLGAIAGGLAGSSAPACPCAPLTIWWERLFDLLKGQAWQTQVSGKGVISPPGTFLLHPPQYVPPSGPGCPVQVTGWTRVRPAVGTAAVAQGELIRETEQVLRKLTQTRRVFQMAERYQKEGELELAQACYEEVALLFPGSRYGQVAAQRIDQIEKIRREPIKASEESEELGEENEQPLSPQAQERRNRLRAAVDLFTVGERCWRKGDLEMAQNCFREVIHICPDSDLAHSAQRKLTILQALQEVTNTEASEPGTGSDLPQESSQLQPALPALEVGTIRALEQLYAQIQRCQPAPNNGDCQVITTQPRVAPAPSLTLTGAPCRRVYLACEEEQVPQTASQQKECWQSSLERLMNVLGPVEVDIDMTRPGAVRYQGKVYYGLVGLIIRGEYTPNTSTVGIGLKVLP